MCRNKSPPPVKRSQRRKNVSLKPSQKFRTKRRKPKYQSLSLKLNPDNLIQNSVKKSSSSSPSKIMKKKTQKLINKTEKGKKEEEEDDIDEDLKLIDLFPIRPRHLNPPEEEDYGGKSDMQEVARFLFDSATDSTATLNDLLSSSTATTTTAPTTSEEVLLSPPLMMTYAYGGREIYEEEDGTDGEMLVRAAMRRGRDVSEERWVSYSEVVEEKAAKSVKKTTTTTKKKKVVKEEEVVSRSSDRVGAGAWGLMDPQQGIGGMERKMSLALKLDYQEIMDAWSDKGPLYVHEDGESPAQTVPDLHDPNVPINAWDNLWTVPEMASNISGNSLKTNEDEMGSKECWKREHREASMLRYKEKRQNRLFSKRIRYEVRRLNAEKRPRIKGRFVKRSSET